MKIPDGVPPRTLMEENVGVWKRACFRCEKSIQFDELIGRVQQIFEDPENLVYYYYHFCLPNKKRTKDKLKNCKAKSKNGCIFLTVRARAILGYS